MGMTNRGWMEKGGESAVINPFMDNGIKTTIPITVDNRYNRGRIPAFSLWAPSDQSSNPWKYMPYIPLIHIPVQNSTSSIEITNEWVDYFRVGDEIIILDVSAGNTNFSFRGKSGDDLTANTLGTDSCTVASVGAKDSGGTGTVLLGIEALNSAVTAGAIGTGDVVVLCGHSTTLDVKSYQEASNVVIMEQAFDFADAVRGGAAGQGGYLVESCVYAYTGRIDYNYIQYYPYLNTGDTSPTLTACDRYTSSRLNFVNAYRG